MSFALRQHSCYVKYLLAGLFSTRHYIILINFKKRIMMFCKNKSYTNICYAATHHVNLATRLHDMFINFLNINHKYQEYSVHILKS